MQSFSYFLYAQKTSSQKLSKLKEFHYNKQFDSLKTFASKYLETLKISGGRDSLLHAKFKYYEHIGRGNTTKNYDYFASLDRLITFCPKTESGDSLKAVLYNKQAYARGYRNSTMKSYRSISKSIKILESLPNPNPGYLMGGYLLQSTNHAYFGNFEQARYHMRLAEHVYENNKKEIDQNTWELNENNHRLGVISKYRKIYMLWKLSKNSEDSLMLVKTMDELDKMHLQPDFHQEERIYYSTALNHVGDWLSSHKLDSTITENDISKGLSYLLKSLELIENKQYPGTIWALKYNIAKSLTRGSELGKADSTMTDLFRGVSPTDGRLPFFLAQKALIKAKKKEKDSALLYFYQSIEKIHSGDETLKSDYSNFKASKRYNHTRLLLRIHEELEKYYSKDSVLKNKIAQIPYMALRQFENSYLDINFNNQQNKELRQIIQGILKSRRTGSIESQLPQKTILNRFEIFKNQLSWKKFYTNRYTNSLPELDSIKQRQVELASLLSKAKIDQNIVLEDSISNLMNQHELTKKKLFPRLELLSDFEFSVEKLQEKLSPNELVLKYIILNNAIAVYRISKTSLKVENVPWPLERKQRLIDFIQGSRDQNYDPTLASEFGKLLLPKIDQDITKLIINPDGILFKLPFEILNADDTLLAETYSIRYTSSLGFIHYTPDHAAASENVHIYAPKYGTSIVQPETRENASFLQGADEEAKTISTLFPSTLFNDESLNKSKFLATSGEAKVLHLAMHAEVNSDYSEFSRLLFSNNLDNEEEHLYLEELYGLSLSADLAILSACNTGTGIEKNGSVESFQRAFTFAGVPATVASLWAVPDTSTQEIMVLFYKNLKKGQSKSVALQNAKLAYRKNHVNTKLSAPYFWAGFVIYGSDTPVIKESNTSMFYMLSVLILIIVGIYYQKRRIAPAL